MPIYRALWVLSLWLLCSGFTLQQLQQLQQQGLNQLVLKQLEHDQLPFPTEESTPIQQQQWWQWERIRHQMLQQQQHWSELVSRFESYPLLQQRQMNSNDRALYLQALMETQAYSHAQQVIQRLIWQPAEGPIAPADLKQWRRALIRLYLLQNQPQQALASLRRFHADYGLEGRDNTTELRIFFINGALESAALLLAGLPDEPLYRFWRQLLQLRQRQQLPDLLQQGLQRLAQSPTQRGNSYERKWDLILVAAAAVALERHQTAVESLELLFAQEGITEADLSLAGLNGDTLWSAYQSYALEIANSEQLLIGEESRWLRFAALQATALPAKSRALVAYLLAQSESEGVRERAGSDLLTQLRRINGGERTLFWLYRHSLKPPPITDEIRLILVEQAIGLNRLSDAEVLLNAMGNFDSQSAEGATPARQALRFNWQLQQARIAIRLQSYPKAETVVGSLIRQLKPMAENPDYDKVMQLIFDLQEEEQHPIALHLLQQIAPKAGDEQRRRERFFWIGDSYFALKEYALAAGGYLQAAYGSNQQPVNDQWGETARYRAVQALRQGRWYDDAAVLLRQLIKFADKSRQPILQQELQEVEAAAVLKRPLYKK